MNSVQKHSLLFETESPETYVVSFEKNLLSLDLSATELLMKKLQFLGLHFNPFEEAAGSECEQILAQLGLTAHVRNPYLATNLLLQLLDKTEERLNNLKQ